MKNRITRYINQFLERTGLDKLYVSTDKKSAFYKGIIAILVISLSYYGMLSIIFQGGKFIFVVLYISFIALIIGVITLTSALFKILFNVNAVNKDGKTTDELQKTDSIPLMLYWFCVVIFITLPIKGCSDEQDRIRDEQLHIHGKTIQIKINCIGNKQHINHRLW